MSKRTRAARRICKRVWHLLVGHEKDELRVMRHYSAVGEPGREHLRVDRKLYCRCGAVVKRDVSE